MNVLEIERPTEHHSRHFDELLRRRTRPYLAKHGRKIITICWLALLLIVAYTVWQDWYSRGGYETLPMVLRNLPQILFP